MYNFCSVIMLGSHTSGCLLKSIYGIFGTYPGPVGFQHLREMLLNNHKGLGKYSWVLFLFGPLPAAAVICDRPPLSPFLARPRPALPAAAASAFSTARDFAAATAAAAKCIASSIAAMVQRRVSAKICTVWPHACDKAAVDGAGPWVDRSAATGGEECGS